MVHRAVGTGSLNIEPDLTGIIIFARRDSRRLPGKVLLKIGGREMLGRIIDRLRLVAGNSPIVIATSSRDLDRPIADFAVSERLSVYRGSAHDVTQRARDCAVNFGFSRFIRISGDSPFVDPDLINRVIGIHRQDASIDVATNVFPRTFPTGTSVETIATGAVERLLLETKDSEDREHVTRFFYRCPERFVIRNVSANDDRFANVNLAVDTADDLARANWIVANASKAPAYLSLEETSNLARLWDNASDESRCDFGSRYLAE